MFHLVFTLHSHCQALIYQHKLQHISSFRNWKNVIIQICYQNIPDVFWSDFISRREYLIKYKHKYHIAREDFCGYFGPVTTVLRGNVSNEVDKTRTALFWVITQTLVAISYRRFGTTYPIGPIFKDHGSWWSSILRSKILTKFHFHR